MDSPVRITRAIEFSSSLRYASGLLDEAGNRERFGAAASRHGHNYRLEVTLEGEPDAVTGMVVNLADLKVLLEDEIMTRFDHRDLNDDTSYFEKQPPTPENFAQVIYGILRDAVPAALPLSIRLYQDSDLFVDVDGRQG